MPIALRQQLGIVSAVGDRPRPEVHRLNAAVIYSKVHDHKEAAKFVGPSVPGSWAVLGGRSTTTIGRRREACDEFADSTGR